MTEKKVIFVGGTAYSGSTFFDMTLGNDPAGFSIGEVYALFRPYRAHHVNPVCGCGDQACDFWSQLLAGGEQNLYQTIFQMKPEVSFIVDSSKDPFWISRQTQYLKDGGIETKNIVIWKTPLELAHSYKKRGQIDAWERSWVNYFRLYHTKVRGWRSVPYADYARDPAVLESICRYLDIPYFVGKEEFWLKKHHLLFGNESARVHLQRQENNAGRQETFDDGQAGAKELRTVYYKPVDDPELEELVAGRVNESATIQDIVQLLTARDVRNDTVGTDEAPGIRMDYSNVQLRKLKQSVTRGIGRLRYVRKGSQSG